MNTKIREHINKSFKQELGISYDEFELLDFDEQQRLIEKVRKNNKRKKSNRDDVTVMIGSGEHAIFVKMKRGQRYMLDDGTFVEAGDTPSQSRNRVEDRLDDIVYSKPVAFVKKLTRKIKNR